MNCAFISRVCCLGPRNRWLEIGEVIVPGDRTLARLPIGAHGLTVMS